MQPVRWPWIGLRFVLALLALTAIGVYQGQAIIAEILPVLRWTFEQVADQYRVLKFALATTSSEHVIELKVTLARVIVVGENPVFPNPKGQATITTLSAHVLQPWIVGLAALFAWPLRHNHRLREGVIRAMLGAVLLTLVMLVDVPLLLAGELSDIFTATYEPHKVNVLTLWVRFLEEGGRYVLAIAAAWVATEHRLT
jgi:hypothetical protein